MGGREREIAGIRALGKKVFHFWTYVSEEKANNNNGKRGKGREKEKKERKKERKESRVRRERKKESERHPENKVFYFSFSSPTFFLLRSTIEQPFLFKEVNKSLYFFWSPI